MDSVDALVIGAGVVGLAIGRALAMSGMETVVLERANAIGTGTSSRNSEVIHAGIYYAPDTLKARMCVQGRQQLYPFLASHGVHRQRVGRAPFALLEQFIEAFFAAEALIAREGVARFCRRRHA